MVYAYGFTFSITIVPVHSHGYRNSALCKPHTHQIQRASRQGIHMQHT